MDLSYYLWKNKISQVKFSKQIGLSKTNLSGLVTKKNSPSLVTAIKIHRETDGQVSYSEMLRPLDALKLKTD